MSESKNVSDSVASLEEIKEQLIEFWTQRWAPTSMSEILTTENLEVFSEFKSASLEGDYSHDASFPGSDLDSFLDNVVAEEASDLALAQGCVKKMADPNISAGVGLLLDEDLARTGQKLRDDATGLQKALAIVRHRSMKSLKTSSRDYDSEFEVHLHVLIDGHGGNYRRQPCFFSYTTSWPLFLESLRKATEQSKIPPTDLFTQYYWPELQIESHSQDALFSSSSTASDRAIQESVDTMIGLGLSTESSPTSNTTRGYTLEHGPWIYQLFRVKKGDLRLSKLEGPKTLSNATDFKIMTDDIRKGRRITPGEYRRVDIVHKLDRIAQEQWKKIRDAEDAAEDSFRLECKEAGMEEEDIGIPFMRYMENNMEMGRSSVRTRHLQKLLNEVRVLET